MARLRLLLLAISVLAGCGDDAPSTTTPDAAAVDAGADAATSDAPTAGPVTLTITVNGAPAMGVEVYFQNADSSLVALVTTDASGAASATMEPGGFVTAIEPFPEPDPARTSVKTFAGVKPGDQLTLVSALRAPPRGMTIVVPFAADASTYEITTTCGSTQALPSGAEAPQPVSLMLRDCGPRFDLLATTLDAGGGATGQIYLPDQAVVEGGTVTVPGTYAALSDSTFTITNAGAYPNIDVNVRTFSPRGLLPNGASTGTLTGGAATLAVPRMVLPGSTVAAGYIPGPAAGFTEQSVTSWGPDAAATTFDLGAALLPAYLDLPTFDAAGHAVTWPAAATGATPDLAFVDLNAVRTVADVVTSVRWSVAAPYTGGVVTLPVLPGSAATYNVLATDEIQLRDLTTSKLPGGYDAARPVLLNRSPAWQTAPIGATATGTVTVALLARP